MFGEKDDRMRNARKLFNRIQDSFPGLVMKLGHNPQSGGLAMEIPVQPGLSLPVHLDLQLDGFGMKVGQYQLEWVRHSDVRCQEAFYSAVCGVLTGRLRVLEHCRGARAVQAELQEPDGDGWRTVEAWSTAHFHFPWRKTEREYRNTEAAHQQSGCQVRL